VGGVGGVMMHDEGSLKTIVFRFQAAFVMPFY